MHHYKRINCESIERIHTYLDTAFSKAYFESGKYIVHISNRRNVPKRERFSHQLFVNLKEPQPDKRLIGYYIYEGVINRTFKFYIDYALLFPIQEVTTEPIDFETLKTKIRNSDFLILKFFSAINYSNTIFDIKIIELKQDSENLNNLIRDDLGKIYTKFDNIKFLCNVPIPQQFLKKKYYITDLDKYAPLTKTIYTQHCILVAEKPRKIKVLRWKKTAYYNYQYINRSLSKQRYDYLFELGYLNHTQIKELYNFMVQNHCEILAASLNHNVITLCGGLDYFLKESSVFPKCLINIPIKWA